MIVPSIDIMDGKAVQLRRGREHVLTSDRSPIELAREFNRYGEVAVVDLDAALGSGNNRNLIEQICRVCDARVGGGIRDKETATSYLKAGARRLMIGTRAEPEFLKQLPRDKIVVALDQVDGTVVDRGWTNSTGEAVENRAARLAPYCAAFLVTFVHDEGSMSGINLKAVEQLRSSLPLPLTVAGGVRNSEDAIGVINRGAQVQVGMSLYTGNLSLADVLVETVKFDDHGLVPTVVQDQQGNLLMVAYSNRESLRLALTNGVGAYFSRSRQKLWEKGQTSGNQQELIACRVDCDRDCLQFTVNQHNVACHSGSFSCFDGISRTEPFSLTKLFALLSERKDNPPAGSYSAQLFRDRQMLIEKIREESGEVISYTSRENLRWEIADLLYFLSVLAVDEGICWKEIESELAARAK